MGCAMGVKAVLKKVVEFIKKTNLAQTQFWVFAWTGGNTMKYIRNILEQVKGAIQHIIHGLLPWWRYFEERVNSPDYDHRKGKARANPVDYTGHLVLNIKCAILHIVNGLLGINGQPAKDVTGQQPPEIDEKPYRIYQLTIGQDGSIQGFEEVREIEEEVGDDE